MNNEKMQSEAVKHEKTVPIYLAIQGIVLLLTFLESPIYYEGYLKNQIMTVTGWLGVWFVLVVFGLAAGCILLIRKDWQQVVVDRERVGKLAIGYFSGALAGLLSLGIRFMPIMPATYFHILAGLVALGLMGYAVWMVRSRQSDEIFS